MKKQAPFNAKSVELKGRNLIEASAGTGKTYSVAILALRLILEKDIPVERILMVTFTNAAVAELELRIRKFVRAGLRYAVDNKETDPEIIEVVEKTGKEASAVKLKRAVLSLDELSVFTIHAFCQKTISEFTFETAQSFDYEILKDDSDLFRITVEKYVRERLNTIPDFELFERVWDLISFDELTKLLRKQVEGMELFEYPADSGKTLEEITGNFEKSKRDLEELIERNRDRILGLPNNNLTKILKEGGTIDNFISKFRTILDCLEEDRPQYFGLFGFMTGDFIRLDDAIKKSVSDAAGFFFNELGSEGGKEMRRIKEARGHIGFDDQIKTIHSALGNVDFTGKLAEKYDAVFIDEFQDTDKLQYEIFSRIFPDDKTIFFIGDPKQSIYGWRKADLDTYNDAKTSVGDRRHTMASNFRSTEKLVNALEKLFSPADGYNIFEDDKIRFEKVDAGASDPGVMCDNGNEVVPVSVKEFDENDNRTNIAFVAGEVLRLLNENVTINGNRVKPSDIAVLVREGREGDMIKAALAAYNIPSVKRDDMKVLRSEEACQISHLIKAVLKPGSGNINRALYNRHFGFNLEKINKLDDEKKLEIFLNLNKTLSAEGVYNMISEFLDSYGVRQKCMSDVLGQRVLANIIQVAELLHRAEKRYRYSPAELLAWMNRSAFASEDEFEQRIESDEDAVQISTIHKCKGLTYKIVFAPFLSMIPKRRMLKKGYANDFRKNRKYYITLDYENMSPEDREYFDTQKEQENRRLIYVALTRAVYKCYISLVPRVYGLNKEPVESSLLAVLKHYDYSSNGELIDYEEIPKAGFIRPAGRYAPADGEGSRFEPRDNPGLEVKNTFGIHSYSELNKLHYSAPFEKTELGGSDSYDQFIFQELGRGANTGTALHAILERLDFNDPATWKKTLEDASKYWSGILKEEKLEFFRQLLGNVMNAKIPFVAEGFSLKNIDAGHKLPELDFYFSLDKINRQDLNSRLGDEARLTGTADIQGLMTGSIDLFFEHGGKYYILDWKSNHLGNDVNNYVKDGLDVAMKGSNYELQYVIYTLAAVRWLKSRIPSFDYEKQFGGVIYVFLRGVREGNETGIYTAKPAKATIEALDNDLKGLQEA